MEIIKQIAEDNGKEVEINNMEFDSLTVALKNGQLDAVIAGMTVTDERKEAVDFSDPYYVAKQVMIVPEDSTIAKASIWKVRQLQSFRVTQVKLPFRNLVISMKHSRRVQKLSLNLQMVSVMLQLSTPLQLTRYVKDNAGLKIVEDNDIRIEEYAIAVKKGDTETLELINASIKKMKEDGTIDAISAKYADMSAEDDTA